MTATPIPVNDLYRAVVETYDYRWLVVAKGNRTHCETYLAEWLERNPLPPLSTAYVLRVEQRIPGPLVPKVACGQEAAAS
jgi:hypothetical protein